MSSKRRSLENSDYNKSPSKISKKENKYFKKILQESGLNLNYPPAKCVANHDLVVIIRNIKSHLQKHIDYPHNVSTLYTEFEEECKDISIFKHYLFPNIIIQTDEHLNEKCFSDSVIKILLCIPILQNKLIDFIFGRAMDLVTEPDCGPWIQTILKCLSTLDNLVDSEKISTNLINLLDVTQEKMVRLEIITAIPDIIGDQEHDNIAEELSRIMSEDSDLIPAILDCLSYLCLTGDQYNQLQQKTLKILTSLSQCSYFPNCVKFLLMSGSATDNSYMEMVQGLRNALRWSTTISKPQDIATSQVLTAAAIRNSIVSSKVIGNSWMKVILNCKSSADHKPIDFALILIIYSSSEDKQKLIDNIIQKQVKADVLKENIIDEAFENFVPILKDNIKHLISLTNSLLKNSEPILNNFASHLIMLMFSKLDGCSQTIVAELLQLGLDCKTCVKNILQILNNVALKDLKLLKPQSIQMLTLLDRMDTMSLSEIRATMALLCGLAYGLPNSVIRDDIHMVIRKELGSSNPSVKVQGVLAGTYAVKYLMVSTADVEHPIELPDDVNYSSYNYLAEGDLREAAQIIELISRSTRQFPHMIAFFYDELGQIIHSTDNINKHFLAWLNDAVTNDLQQNFIVDSLEYDALNNLKLQMQYCSNTDSEMDDVIAINIAGLTLKDGDVNICVLPSLFQVVQILHSKQHDGNLSTIDALLGCPVVMPIIDVNTVEDLSTTTIVSVVDCLVHCVNWFIELINAFCSQTDPTIRLKIFPRMILIEELENLIEQILIKCNVSYKPPLSSADVKSIIGDVSEKKPVKISYKQKKRTINDDSTIADTGKTQVSQRNPQTIKSKLDLIQNIHFRSFNLELVNLLKVELSEDNDTESNLTVDTLTFVFKYANNILENILISKIKRNTFLSKNQDTDAYDHSKAEHCAKHISTILPFIANHLKFITSHLDNICNEDIQNENGYTTHCDEVYKYVSCLELIYNFYNIYFGWIGFKSHNTPLLKTSLRTVASISNDSSVSIKENVFAIAKYLQIHVKYCFQLSTAVALIGLMTTVSEFSSAQTVIKIIKGMASEFLAKLWKTPDGIPEKGIIFNQNIDSLAKSYFINNEILALKNIALLLVNDIEVLKNSKNTLDSFKSINKGNFAILYRNLGTAVYGIAKSKLDKGLTNAEHLDLWKDVAIILKSMLEMSKKLETRNNLSAFFKKCLPIIKLFNTHGIPIFDIEFKNKTQEIIEILKILQQTTRFLQSLCCHSHLKRDTVLMNKVPFMRQLLETLIYKIKAMLIANKCSEAFWMGNLKNKNIHGEVIATQQSNDGEDSVEDCDEQLPDDSDNTDDEMINPDSKSLSDII